MSSFYLEDGIEVCYYLDQYEEADESTGSPEVFTFEYEIKMDDLFSSCKSVSEFIEAMKDATKILTDEYPEDKINELIQDHYNKKPH